MTTSKVLAVAIWRTTPSALASSFTCSKNSRSASVKSVPKPSLRVSMIVESGPCRPSPALCPSRAGQRQPTSAHAVRRWASL